MYAVVASILASTVLLLGAVNLPAHWFSVNNWFGQTFGTAFTQLAGSDTLSNFPTTYNANLALTPNLTTANSFTAGVQQFISASSTSLGVYDRAAFGATATSTFSSAGALTLITPLLAASGGTASSSPTLNQIMFGNGSSGFKVIGFGMSGQFLQSQGDAAVPVWSTASIDEAAAYTWTGAHIWTASTTHTATTTFADLRYGTSSYYALLPTGTVISMATCTPPYGFLRADGSAVSRTTFWQLFTVIGTTFGVGDGSTTFNLPNLGGRNILHASSTANISQTGGESNHTLTINEMPAHTHDTVATPAGGTILFSGGGSGDDSGTSGSTGGGAAHNVLDPYIVMCGMIAY